MSLDVDHSQNIPRIGPYDRITLRHHHRIANVSRQLTEHGDRGEDGVITADVGVHLHHTPPRLSREQRGVADRGTADVRGHIGGGRERLWQRRENRAANKRKEGNMNVSFNQLGSRP